jgi:hypothetical protein
MGKTETISSEVSNETWVSTLSTVVQYILGIPSQSNKVGRRNKMSTNRKGRSETISIFR